MNGERVGVLTRTAPGALRFRYEETWLSDERATPISLSMPLSPDPYGDDRVESFFDNLLPDNVEIRQRIQALFAVPTSQPFDLLSRIGHDCVGALQLTDDPAPSSREIRSTPLSGSEVAAVLREYRRRPLGMDPSRDDFRISIAGVQEKTAFLLRDGVWHRPEGPTPTTHIFKLPIGRIGDIDLASSVEIEWLCLKLATGLGANVANATIERFDDLTVLVVERFDRTWSSDRSWIIRLPQEDLCQALRIPPGLKYESDGGPCIKAIMGLLRGSVDPQGDRRSFLRATMIFWILGAIDGHAKNFSVQLLPAGRFKLAPLYDVMSAYGLMARREMKMAMAVRGKNTHYKWDTIQPRHWISTAKACGFPEDDAHALLEKLARRVPAAIEEATACLPEGFPPGVSEPIFDGMRTAAGRIEGYLSTAVR